MSADTDTIVAIATAPGRAALGIVRLSGPAVRFVSDTICGMALTPRRAHHVRLRASGAILDDAIALWFPAPNSATGQDVLELTCHGGRGVLAGVLEAILALRADIRLAEPGEFTRQAFEAGKLDALQVEALGDLLAAETRGQVQQARRQLEGRLGALATEWRANLIEARAHLEATLDFSDEGDVDVSAEAVADRIAVQVRHSIGAVLAQAARGERVRDGVRIVITGAPNTGKSTLLNALAGRDAALVSPIAGTTRDRIEVAMELDGWPVLLSDTAGLRHTQDAVEAMGVALARSAARDADLVLSLACAAHPQRERHAGPAEVIEVTTMIDIPGDHPDGMAVSALSGVGLDDLRATVATRVGQLVAGEPALVSRARQRERLEAALKELDGCMEARLPELKAEHLRKATQEIGRLVGLVDVEDVLDRLFAGFCIGK